MEVKGDCFWTYVLEDSRGRFYVGHTDDLELRLAEHNDPARDKTKFTAKARDWRVVWREQFGTRSEAMARERAIKAMKSSRWIRERLLNR